MAQFSRPWPGVTVGDAGPYSADNWYDVWGNIIQGGNALGEAAYYNLGVFLQVGNQLNAAIVGATVTVDTGASLVDGLFHYNNASVSIPIPAAAAGLSRIDYIVVRKNYDLAVPYTPTGAGPVVPPRTARITVIRGTEAAGPVAPTLTWNTARTTYWDIPIATVQVSDTDGDLTDLAQLQEYLLVWDTDNIADGAITEIKHNQVDTEYGDYHPLLRQATDAIQADVGGGIARGAFAIDLQQVRDPGSPEFVASGDYSSICGGEDNRANGDYSVAGGRGNRASAAASIAIGGTFNVASGAGAATIGGTTNVSSGLTSITLGGTQNLANGDYSVAAGRQNTVSGISSTIAGGQENDITQSYATISGGLLNSADGTYSTVAGGDLNTASGFAATVLGGESNAAAGGYSVAAGRRALTGANDGVFIFADSEDANFTADRADQFKVRAKGGVHLVQNGAASAIPVLELEQDDPDEPFIEFDGTSAADASANISTMNGGAGAVDGPLSGAGGWTFNSMVKINQNGTDVWIASYTPVV